MHIHHSSLLTEAPLLFPLPSHSIITIKGDNAQTFLQGQLTCNVKEVSQSQMRFSAMCNIKGRILALLDVIFWQNYLLVASKSLLEITIATLEKTALLNKVTCEPLQNMQVYGLYFPNPDPLLAFAKETCAVHLQEDTYCYALGDNFYILLAPALPPFAASFTQSTETHWHALQLARKRIELYPETRGSFLPHRLDLHLRNYISLDKGCYKGQEIIARTHFLGRHKYTLKIFSVTTEEPLIAGMKIESASQQSLGELVDFCSIKEHEYLIAASLILDTPREIRFLGHKNTCVLS